jgi:hypothetical protein
MSMVEESAGEGAEPEDKFRWRNCPRRRQVAGASRILDW